jgi:hypothetical protein
MPVTDGTARTVLRRFTLGSGPLKRGSDRLQFLARVLLALLLLTSVPVSLAVATATYTDGLAEAADQAATRHRTTAVLLEDASASSDGSLAWRARVTWSTARGGTQETLLRVPPEATAGASVTIWVDREGGLADPPLTGRDAGGEAIASGTLTFLSVATFVTLLYEGFRLLLDRSRARRWAADWAVIEPIWTGKVP